MQNKSGRRVELRMPSLGSPQPHPDNITIAINDSANLNNNGDVMIAIRTKDAPVKKKLGNTRYAEIGASNRSVFGMRLAEFAWNPSRTTLAVYVLISPILNSRALGIKK